MNSIIETAMNEITPITTTLGNKIVALDEIKLFFSRIHSSIPHIPNVGKSIQSYRKPRRVEIINNATEETIHVFSGEWHSIPADGKHPHEEAKTFKSRVMMRINPTVLVQGLNFDNVIRDIKKILNDCLQK